MANEQFGGLQKFLSTRYYITCDIIKVVYIE